MRKITAVSLLPETETSPLWMIGDQRGLNHVTVATSIDLSSRSDYDEDPVDGACLRLRHVETVLIHLEDGSAVEFDRANAMISWSPE